jgi:type VI secretion system secreted protein VgrG
MARVEFKLLGDDLPLDVSPHAFVSREALSTPYEVEITFSSLDEAFEPATCLRKSFTLVLVDPDKQRTRLLSGVCAEAELVHHDGVRFHFRLVLAPPVAALAQREDCRIYQDKSVIDVVKELLAAAGVDKVEYRLRQSYPPREYVVQYRETELAFFHRLLEDEGIFYFFEHTAGEVTMVLADSIQSVATELEAPVVLGLTEGFGGTDPITDIAFTRRLRASDVMLRDFDFEKPQLLPTSAQSADAEVDLPYYEYPGGFVAAADGQRRATARLTSMRADAETLRGKTRVLTLEVGKLVSVTGAAQDRVNGRFVVTSLVSRGRQSPTGRDENSAIENEIAAIPEGLPFAPERRTKRPVIRGVQTAVVTGPTMGEEDIHVDNYGRVKVRFHWDRAGQFDDRSSCWMRVMQVPLGGGMIIPRAGWEVSVAFLEGNPDRPVVVGRVYNAERVPPYALPGAKATGAIKSASSPGGAGANEINLGDSGGSQGFSVTAQKDLNVSVGHDQNETVAVNDSTTIKVNASKQIGANQTVSVGGNQETNVGSQNSAKVSGDISISVGGNAVDNATANYVEKVGGDRSSSVGGNQLVICNGIQQTITGNISRDVGAVDLCASVASITAAVGGNVTEKIGVAKIDLCKGAWVETISGNKMSQIAVGELEIVKGSYSSSSDAAMTSLVGALRYAKVAGDYTISAPMVTLLGATGAFKGGGSELKLGGAPIVIKGSKVSIEAAMVVKLGSSLKMGG